MTESAINLLEQTLSNINVDPYVNAVRSARKVASIYPIVQTLDPAWAQTFEENNTWLTLLLKADELAVSNQKKLVELCEENPLHVNAHLLQLWFEADPESLLVNFHKLDSLTSGLPMFLVKTWPDEYLMAAGVRPGVYLEQTGKEWKELDPESYQSTLEAIAPQWPANEAIAELWVRDALDNFKETNVAKEEVKPSKISKLLRRNRAASKNKEPQWQTRATKIQVHPRAYEVWSELDPEGFLKYVEENPSTGLLRASEAWARVNVDSYLRYARQYPRAAIAPPDTLYKISPELLAELVEDLVKDVKEHFNLDSPWADGHQTRAMMLVNPEKYKENMHLDTIFDTSLDLWLKHNRKEVEDYIQGNDIRTLGNSDNTTWILDTLAENDPEILDLLLVKVANDRIQRILPGEKHLQTWLDNNPTNWLQEGGNLLTRILEDTKVTNPIGNSMVVRTLLGTLSHYQQHPTELKENLLNQATEGQIWLELIDGMLDKETKDSLVEGILEDPRQPADKIAWATLRAANVDLSEENIPGPRVKLKKPKEGRDTPSRGI